MIFLIIFFICLLILIYTRYLNKLNIENYNNENNIIELNNITNDVSYKKNKNIKKIDAVKEVNIVDKLLLKCFNKNEFENFNKKYSDYSRRIVFRDAENKDVKGVVFITPSKYITELPQITLDGYFINNLCVDSKYRRNGIAKKLITYIINKAKKEDKMHLILQVDKNSEFHRNSDFLIDFYLDMGFKQYLNNESMVIMIHTL